MGFKLNVFTGTFDLVGTSGSGVARVGPTSDKRITRWSGVDSDTIQDSNAEVQDGGSVQAQGYVGRKEINDQVILPSKHYMISSGLTIMNNGSIVIGTDSELILI